MQNNGEYIVPCNRRSNISFENVDFDYFNGDMMDNTANDSCNVENLAWKLNMEMRHAVLPVTIFVGIEAVVGFVGNFLVLYVFLFRYPVCNFRYFVLSLALIDFVSTLTTMPGEIVTQLYWYVYPLPTFCKVKSFFNVFTVCAEALFLFTIAVDRYRKVCTPFGKQIRPKTAKVICLLIFCVAFVIALPVGILWGTSSRKHTYKNHIINVTFCEKDQYFVNTLYPVTYVITIQTVVISCLISMLVLYILVAKRLVSCRIGRNQSSGSVVMYSQTNGTNLANLNFDHNKNAKQEVLTVHGLTSGSAAKNHLAYHSKAVQTFAIPNHLDIPRRPEDTSHKTEVKESVTGIPRRLHQNFIVSPARQRIAETARVRRKTLIMFILTVVFIVTAILYLTLLAMIARSDDILQAMSDTGKVTYFFFFRLVFINHVINPFIYGFLDTQFNSGLNDLRRRLLRLYTVRVRPN